MTKIVWGEKKNAPDQRGVFRLRELRMGSDFGDFGFC
jgi:hypothetical protein